MQFVFDLDGTICFRGQPISKKIVEALDNCMKNGHEVIFASARPIRDLLPVLPKEMHAFPMVGGNGVFIANEGEIIKVTAFEKEIVQELLSFINTYKLPYLVDGKWDYAYTGSKEHPIYRNLDPLQLARNVQVDELEELVKIVLFPGEVHGEIVEKLKQFPISIYEHTNENILDVSPNGINKWRGLVDLGVQERAFVAFGNDTNDRSMFVHAKESICVGNHPVSKMATKCINNEEDAVIEVIRNFSEQYK